MVNWHSKLVSVACVVAFTLAVPVLLVGCAAQEHVRSAEAASREEVEQAAVPVAPTPIELNIEVDGSVYEVSTIGTTVQEVLAELEIVLGEFDRVEPGLDKSLDDVALIKVVRVRIVEETTSHRIYYHEVRRPNTTMELGVTKTVQQGKEGQRVEHYRVVVEDGVEIERSLTGTEVLSQKVDRIVEYGTVGTIIRGGIEYRFTKVITVQATAYTAGPESTGKSPGDPYYGITRSGLPVQVGHIAVDRRVIPLMTNVYVEGLDSRGALFDGKYLATDTGSAIKGNRIDIYFEHVEDALWFGRRQMKVYILE